MSALGRYLRRNTIIDTLFTVRGNVRACLFTEPLWGIPYNLFLPFASVYMSSVGLSATQIGLVATIFLCSQMLWSILGGAITDKLGRRMTTFIFDFFAWGFPCLLWMTARSFPWFAAAALFNGCWRVTETSWRLLMIEDAPEDKVVRVFAVSHIAGLLAGFFSPIAYFLVRMYGVLSATRYLYAFAFIMMTSKFVILFLCTNETSLGKRRMAERRGVSLVSSVIGNAGVLRAMLKSKRVMYTVGLLACFYGIRTVSNAFWPLAVTDSLGAASENLSLFATLRSLCTLVCYFVIVPRITMSAFKRPLVMAFSLMICRQLMMLFMPGGYVSLIIATVLLEAVALSVLEPLTTSLQMLNVDYEERARMLGMFFAILLVITAPLGALAGALADIDRRLPFALNIVLSVCGVVFSAKIWGIAKADEAAQPQ